MARVIVFLQQDLLQAIDTEAEVSRLNRSSLIQTALIEFLERRKSAREEVRVRKEMEDAGRKMDALAERLGDWDSVKIVRQFRDNRRFSLSEPARPVRRKPASRKGR
jgi:predicted transcriptional regulator